ncbi:MAG: methyltransferase domain-containing protein [Chlamydiales bacterium]|nr:methyltransferase domain-containing protein [Chlamydiales bacterium]
MFFAALALLKHGKWDKYYKNKMGQSPHRIVVNAFHLFQTSGQAIDLGCGVGNEALFLLNNGWNIWAIDSESKAIQLLKNRADINASGKLTAAVANFAKDSIWDTLPTVDFIYAAHALPFCKQTEFENVWSLIKNHLTHEGRFAGHFFGLNYEGFAEREMEEMTFLRREEVLELFQDFDIEHFQEIEEDGLSGTGRPIHSHIFEVIAHKKS